MIPGIMLDPAKLPDNIAALKAMLVDEHAARVKAETIAVDAQAEIQNLKLTIAKLQRDRFGAKSERGAKLLEQLELQLAELEASVVQDRVADELAQPASTACDERQKPARRPLPDHLPRERVVHTAPEACSSCGGTRLRKLSEDITETLEYVPARWKVIQHVREKFTCRDCETITQAPKSFAVSANRFLPRDSRVAPASGVRRHPW